MGSSDSKNAQKSIEAQKIKQFFTYYGFKSGPQIQPWINGMYSPNFYGSTTFNYGQSKTNTFTKQDLPRIYQRAHKGKYRSHDIKFLKVDNKSRTLYYKWVNNTPHANDPNRRIDIPFESYVVFDQNYKILKVFHNHCPIKKQVVNQVQSQRPGYFSKALDRAQDNMKVVNQLLSQNYYPDNTAINNAYQESQKRFRQNRNKQAREWNNYVNAQKNRYY